MKTEYIVALGTFDLGLAFSKVVEVHTGFNPLTTTKRELAHISFKELKFEGFSVSCEEGNLAYTYTFSDNGELSNLGFI